LILLLRSISVVAIADRIPTLLRVDSCCDPSRDKAM
jgi:hypothetical protein